MLRPCASSDCHELLLVLIDFFVFGFNDLLALLERETIAFARPVVLVHGDTHYFRIDKPLVSSVSHRRLENFTRVETFGNPDSHWVRATVDPRDPQVFTFRQQIVEKNLVKHGK